MRLRRRLAIPHIKHGIYGITTTLFSFIIGFYLAGMYTDLACCLNSIFENSIEKCLALLRDKEMCGGQDSLTLLPLFLLQLLVQPALALLGLLLSLAHQSPLVIYPPIEGHSPTGKYTTYSILVLYGCIQNSATAYCFCPHTCESGE